MIQPIKTFITQQCHQRDKEDFLNYHLLEVEKATETLLTKHPEANHDICHLNVRLHDAQRIFDIQRDHQKAGAQKAKEIMEQHNVPTNISEEVVKCILTHSCNQNNLPTNLEGKILATADAIAHFYGGFYLRIATLGQRTPKEYKKWALEKLSRDRNDKIFFDDVKESLQERYEIIRSFFEVM